MMTYFSPASPDRTLSRCQAARANSGIVASSRLTYSVTRSREEIRYIIPQTVSMSRAKNSPRKPMPRTLAATRPSRRSRDMATVTRPESRNTILNHHATASMPKRPPSMVPDCGVAARAAIAAARPAIAMGRWHGSKDPPRRVPCLRVVAVAEACPGCFFAVLLRPTRPSSTTKKQRRHASANSRNAEAWHPTRESLEQWRRSSSRGANGFFLFQTSVYPVGGQVQIVLRYGRRS